MAWDTNLFFALHNLAGKSVFFDSLTVFFAEYLPYLLGMFFLIFIFVKIVRSERIRVFLTGIIAIAVARGLLTEIIRFFYHRLRPFLFYNFQPLIPESGYSFPSGHATFFFSLSAVIYYYNKRWGLAFLVASTLMGIARVITGVHYPTDIIGGAIIGWLVGWLVFKFTKKKTVIL